jgi:hypothetical protein
MRRRVIARASPRGGVAGRGSLPSADEVINYPASSVAALARSTEPASEKVRSSAWRWSSGVLQRCAPMKRVMHSFGK